MPIHQTRRFVNRPEEIVEDSLIGLALAYPDLLTVHHRPTFVMRADAPKAGKVALISGSGSGHEPLNTGYVGKGMLDAACPGAIFTSATPDQLAAAAQAVDGGAGILFIVKNFTGGVLNAEMAVEMIAAPDLPVSTIRVHDDVTIDDVENRRGMGAAVLVEKIAGAAAEQGRPLADVVAVGERVSHQTRSIGVGWPTDHAGFTPETVQLGMGIHGEPGRFPFLPERNGDWTPPRADAIAAILVDALLADLSTQAGDELLVLVSGMGGTPLMELYVIYRHIHQILADRGITVKRKLIGNFITSLGASGCTISFLKLDPELTALWDAPVHTPALRW